MNDQYDYEERAAIREALEKDLKKQRVPGLERAIPKTKGVEFSGFVHQLGVDPRADVADFEFPGVHRAEVAHDVPVDRALRPIRRG